MPRRAAEGGPSAYDDLDDDKDDDQDDLDERHRFEAMIDHVANRDKVSKAKAAATARKEYPRLFSSYQASVGLSNSYRRLVEDEIRKGNTVDVACQKIGYAYPGLARAGTNDLNTGWRRECPSTIENYIAISKACERVGFRTHKPTPN